MELDQTASVLPLVLGIMATLVTIYPPSGRRRGLWVAAFILSSIIAAVLTWFAVSVTQEFQNRVLTNVDGGNNYTFIWLFHDAKDRSGPLDVMIKSERDTPMFDLDILIYRRTTPSEQDVSHSAVTLIGRFDFGKMISQFQPTNLRLGQGFYIAMMSSRNGFLSEQIDIKKSLSGLTASLDGFWMPEKDPKRSRKVFSFDTDRSNTPIP